MLKLFKKENELTYVNEDDKVFEDEILESLREEFQRLLNVEISTL